MKQARKKLLGSQDDCIKQHFYEVFITYRFFDSFRTTLQENDYLDLYKIYLKKKLGTAKLKQMNMIRSKSVPFERG